MRLLRWGAIAIVGLVVVVAIVLQTVDFGAFKGYAQVAVEDATGRRLSIDGPVELKLLPAPSLAATKVRFSNASWGAAPDMATIEKVEARVALLPLVRGEVVLQRLVLISPDILLETDRSGRGNWEFGPSPAPGSRAGEAPKRDAVPLPVFMDVTIEKGRFSFRDGRTGKTTSLALEKLSLHGRGMDAPLDVDAVGDYDGKKFEIAGSVGSLAGLTDNRPWPVDLKAKAGGAEVTAKGSLAKPMEGKGIDLALAAEGKDLAALGKLAGTELPALGAYKLSAKVTGPGPQGWDIKDLAATFGKTSVAGTATMAVDRTPIKLTATLDSPLIDLAAFGPSEAKTGAPPSDDRVFGATPLPLEGLKSIDAELSLSAKRVVRKKLAAENVTVRIVLQGGRLAVEPLKANLAGGSIDGALSVDGAAATPALTVKATGKDIDAKALLVALGQTDIVEAKAGFHADLHGTGRSMRAIMASLDGTFGVVTGEGKIGSRYVDLVGADLLPMLLSGGPKGEATRLNCLIAPFKVEKGLAKTDAILFDTGHMTVRGEGTVNLRDETLDLLLTPRPKDRSLISLATPVRVGGTLSKPTAFPDKAALAKGLAGSLIGGAIMPLGFLIPLVSGGTGEQNPCVEALVQGKEPPSTAPKPSESKGPVGAIEDIGKGIGQGIRGLFGR